MNLPLSTQLSQEIRALAQKALDLGLSQAAMQEARESQHRPLVYMRYGEAEALLRDLKLEPGMRVVDFSSPQWLGIALAARHPQVQFVYTNIIDSELLIYAEIAQKLGLANLEYRKCDLRALEMPDASFDVALSVSVLEHVFPEVGGDAQALAEIHRVLRPGGQLLLTVPFKDKRNVVYLDEEVFERGSSERNFYAREYDQAQWGELLQHTPLRPLSTRYICERSGLLAVDSIEWGPQRGQFLPRVRLRASRVLGRLLGRHLDGDLAGRYLFVSPRADTRVVNVAVLLQRGRAEA